LVEVILAIFVGMLLMGAAYIAMTTGQKSAAGVERKVAAQQDVRGALQVMAMELSMASFNPNYASGMWHDLPAFGSNVQCTPSAIQASKGIRQATPTSITIEMDLNGDRMAGNAGEIVRYNYEVLPNQAITRESPICFSPRSAAPYFLGEDPTSGNPRTVRVINDILNITNGNGQVAIFRYYNAVGGGTELFPDATPADIPNIRRIDICLAAETDEVDPSTQRPRSMIYSTSVLVRNHAFSLPTGG